MISDALTRLSGTSGPAAAPQVISTVVPATPLLSTNWMDLRDAYNGDAPNGNMADGVLHAVFTVMADITSGDLDNMLEFQLISTPRTVATGQTFTAAVTDICSIVGGDFLPNGTLVTVSSGTALPAGLVGFTHYYVVEAARVGTTQTFKLATTPDGWTRAGVSSVVNITGTGTGTHTILHIPQVIASSGPVPLGRLRPSATGFGRQVGDQITIVTNPLPQSPQPPLHGFLFARYVLAASTLSAGSVFCDVGCGVPSNRAIYHASGFEIA